MKYLDIQKAKVPVIGLGTWEITGASCISAVKSALEIGYRHIDTAQMYGNEAEIGVAISESGIDRKEIFITTKILPANLRYDDVLRTADESLKKLKTSYVDLLLIHWPNPRIALEETLSAMSKLKKEGKAKHIGVSNFDLDLMIRAQEHAKIFCNQVEYRPGIPRKRLLDYCQKNGIMMTAYSPLGRGRILKNKVLEQIGKQHNKSVSQVALRWLIQQKNVAAIPKATSLLHQEENLDIFDFTLTDDEMEAIYSMANAEE